jgi:uncharacterized protein with HEPN domain
MSSRSWRDRVGDILEAIDEIRVFTAGMTREQLADDARTLKAVVADFVIIGEAATHVPDDVVEQYADVPWRLMRDMRNRLVHVYFEVDPDIVWQTVESDLPKLVDQLRAVIAQDDSK